MVIRKHNVEANLALSDDDLEAVKVAKKDLSSGKTLRLINKRPRIHEGLSGRKSTMNRKLKIFVIGVITVVVLIMLTILLTTPDFYNCYSSGGRFRTFSNTCVDSCELVRHHDLLCGMKISKGCDCDSDKCWNGNKCVKNSDITG